MGSEEGGSNESNQASQAQQDNAGPEGEQGSIERTPDVGGISGSGQDVRINNGDIVFYQGNQYEVNGITTDGQFVDLELDGKPAFEDIPVSEVSKTLSQQIESQQPELNPSEAQKEAGNYKKAHVNVQGFDITIENPKGSTRSGIDENGREWSNTLQNHYGYFKRTEGKDGDQIDVFIGENPESETVFVVDQNNPESGAFDESKVMLGFNTPEEAKAAYMSNYEAEWKGFGSITPVSVEDFKKWLYDGAKQRKPFSEYKDTPEAVEVEKPAEKQEKLNDEVEKSGQSLAEESEAVKELREEIKDLKSQSAK